MRWASSLLILSAAACADPAGNPSEPPADSVPWAVADCGLADRQTGWDEGDTLPDFSLENQLGSQTSLHQFCDRTVLIQVSNYW